MDAPGAAPVDPALLERVLQPLELARTLPGEAYASPLVFDWEQRHFLEGSWACVGRSAALAAPGDQQAVRVGTVGVLLVRDDSGALRGFFNVCRHRGHELLEAGSVRNARGIKCPYHSWVYDLAGRCRATPRYGRTPADPDGFDRGDFPLVPVRIAQWRGWVFANVSGDAPPIGEHLGNLDRVVADYQPERLVLGATHEYQVSANWKIVVENYNECYHCSSIHPELCTVTPPESARAYPEPPTGVWVGGPMRLREHAATMSLTGQSLGVPIPTLPEPKRRDVGYLVLLPNLLISLHPDYVMTHRMVPLAHDRTWIECAWLFPPEAFDSPGFTPDYAAEFWDITNREDWQACESVQRNAASPGFRQGPFSPREADVWAAMSIIARGYLHGRLCPAPDCGRVAAAT
jgi:phenylpropionate dioxygenase-like ring-hydroxylating dioxygenase large terminal subunit